MVNYGPQKSEIHYTLYLASVAGNFNMLMLNNYLPLAETLERIVYEKNKDIQRLVLFVPSYVEEEVCKMSKKFLNSDFQTDAVQDRTTMLQQIVLISITDGVKIKCPSKMLETEEMENKIQYTTYFSMINQRKEWKCDQKPLRTSPFRLQVGITLRGQMQKMKRSLLSMPISLLLSTIEKRFTIICAKDRVYHGR